ncbi:hypothetical protein [Micromonospora sp. LOL_023]|uniref:hypothetical protein n=1 Tax=Micromonospora sp. LOL_023 TaxID=3345418 RepID=UPI003A89B1E2
MRQPQPDENPHPDQTSGADGTAVAADAVDGDRPEPTARIDDSGQPTSPTPWRGSAQVPPPQPRQRWWQRDAGPAAAPPPRDPTLHLPAGDRADDDPETRTPVDPWASADLWPAGHPVGDNDAWADAQPVSPDESTPSEPPSYQAPAYAPPGHQPPSYQPPPGPPTGRRQSATDPPPYAGQPPPQVRSGRPTRSPLRAAGPTQHPVPPARPAPPGPPPAARRRRRRRWPWVTSLLTLLTVACCCGAPAYYGKPLWDQYPASPALPGQFADLRLSDDGRSQETVARLEVEMRGAHLLAEDTFAAVYRDGNGKQVVLYGTTGFRISPGSDLTAEMTRIGTEYELGTMTAFETDTRGSHLQCGTGQSEGTDMVVCVWADHGSLGTALFTRRSVEESAELTRRLRVDAIDRQ